MKTARPTDRLKVVDMVRPGMGTVPAVVGVNTKYGHNAASMLRACSCFGVRQLWLSGRRWADEWDEAGRMPREERMKAYENVDVFRCEQPLRAFARGISVVGVEVTPGSQPLTTFVHPENAVYVFGPEDGGLPGGIRSVCHQFVEIPSDACLNLASAVTTVLYDRRAKRQLAGLEPIYRVGEVENRGWWDSDKPLQWDVA